MGAELPALIVLLSISILFNIGFIGYLFFIRKRSSPEYSKVKSRDVETALPPVAPVDKLINEKDGEKPPVARSPEKKDKPAVQVSPATPTPVNALRSVENDLRSEHGVENKEPPQRSDRQRLNEPIGKNEFAICMKSVVQFINEYFDESHKQPVIPENDVDSSRLQVKIPEKGEDCEKIMKDIKEIVVPNICHTQHPRYHAKFSGKSLADIIGNTISTALGHDVNSSPIIETIEQILCKWLSSALGLPQMKREFGPDRTQVLQDPIGAVFYTTRDVYVTVIRHAVDKYEQLHDSLKSDEEKRKKRKDFVVYCSDDAHASLEEACNVAKVKLRKVITMDKDCCGMTAASLEKQMRKDVDRGLTPIVIIANYGSANVAAIDEIWDLVKVSRAKSVWLHMDATYAGCEWLDENRRNNVHTLLSEVHSVHVSLFSLFPYSGRVSIVWSGERLELEGAKLHYGEHPIRLWIMIRLYGIRSIREAVKRKIMLGNAFAERLSHHSEFFDVFHPNEHGVTVFQYNNKSMKTRVEDVNKITSIFYHYLVITSTLKFSLFKFHGKTLIKAVVNYERSNLSMMEESVSTLLNSVEEFEDAIKKKKKSVSESPKVEFCETVGGSPNATTDRTQSDEKEPQK